MTTQQFTSPGADRTGQPGFMLEVRDLNKNFGGLRAVNSFHLALSPTR
jgi:hypothetical protein